MSKQQCQCDEAKAYREAKKEAQRICGEFIGYPYDEDDLKTIEEATPVQAIKALEKEFLKCREDYHNLAFKKKGV